MGLVTPSEGIHEWQRGAKQKEEKVMADNDQEQKVEKKQDMNPENSIEKNYYIYAAMSFPIHPLTLEKELIDNEKTYDDIIKLCDLGLKIYEGALEEAKSYKDKVFNTNKDTFIYFCNKAIEDYKRLKNEKLAISNLPKIEFQKDVNFVDSILLIKALQEHWLEPNKNAFWTNFFKFPTTAKDIPKSITNKLQAYEDGYDLFKKHLLKPGRRLKGDFNDLEEKK